jgi:hypothetical protein
MVLNDELVTSVLLGTADCLAVLLARHRPFWVFWVFLSFLLLYFAGEERRLLLLVDTLVLGEMWSLNHWDLAPKTGPGQAFTFSLN